MCEIAVNKFSSTQPGWPVNAGDPLSMYYVSRYLWVGSSHWDINICILFAHCINSIGQIVKSVCMCMSLSFKRAERSTRLSFLSIFTKLDYMNLYIFYCTMHCSNPAFGCQILINFLSSCLVRRYAGAVIWWIWILGDVITCCFW